MTTSVALATLLIAPTSAIASSDTTAAGTTTARYVVTTATNDAPTVAALNRDLTGHGRRGAVDVTSSRSLGRRLAVVTVRSASAAAAVANALAGTAAITAATPDAHISLDATVTPSGAIATKAAVTPLGTAAPVDPSDPYFADQWDLWDAASTHRAGGYGVDAARAWRRTFGSPKVTVAVLDTGITAHPDLAGVHLAAGYDFVTNDTDDPNGQDVYSNDGDGWDPDPSDPGDFCPIDGEASSWHGTFVTGEIAARRNRTGVVGVAPGVTIEPVRVLGGCGGSESDEIAAITWASGGTVTQTSVVNGATVTTALTNAHPANVITMSLGGQEACDPVLQAAISAAVARNVAIVVAAGNDNQPVIDSAPANCAGVIRVAATTRGGNRATYSDYGTSSLPVTLSAPGGTDANPVLSDAWSSSGLFSNPENRPIVGAYEGTSMAAPRVAATIGLLLSIHPGLTPEQITAAITGTVTPFPKGSTCTVTRCGAGIVNAGNVVGAARRFLSTVRPAISGTLTLHSTVRVSRGTWIPGGTSAQYQWYRSGHPIAHATGRTYRIQAADVGHRLTARVTILRTGYANAWRTSGYRTVHRPA